MWPKPPCRGLTFTQLDDFSVESWVRGAWQAARWRRSPHNSGRPAGSVATAGHTVFSQYGTRATQQETSSMSSPVSGSRATVDGGTRGSRQPVVGRHEVHSSTTSRQLRRIWRQSRAVRSRNLQHPADRCNGFQQDSHTKVVTVTFFPVIF